MTSPELSKIISRIKKSLLSPDVEIVDLGHQITKSWVYSSAFSDGVSVKEYKLNKKQTMMTHVPIGITAETDYLKTSIPVLKYLMGPSIKDRNAAKSQMVDIPASFWPTLLIVIDVEKSDFNAHKIAISEHMLTGSYLESISEFKLETTMAQLNTIRKQLADTFKTIDNETYADGFLFHHLKTTHASQDAVNDFENLTKFEDARYIKLFTLFQMYVASKYTPILESGKLVIKPFSQFLTEFPEPEPTLDEFLQQDIGINKMVLNDQNASTWDYGSDVDISEKIRKSFKLPSKIKDAIPQYGHFDRKLNITDIQSFDDVKETASTAIAILGLFSEIISNVETDNFKQYRPEDFYSDIIKPDQKRQSIDTLRMLAISNSQTFISDNSDVITIIDDDSYYDPESGSFKMNDIKHTQAHDTAKLMSELAISNLIGSELLLSYSDKLVRLGQNQFGYDSLELITFNKGEK